MPQHPAKILSVSNTILIQDKCKIFPQFKVSDYKICFKTVIGFLNMSLSLQIKLAAFIHLAERQLFCVTKSMRERLNITNKNSDCSGVQKGRVVFHISLHSNKNIASR